MKHKLGYVPADKTHLMKCNWLECQAGCGIAGHGGCYRKGEWWKKNCKQFKKDDYIVEANKERFIYHVK